MNTRTRKILYVFSAVMFATALIAMIKLDYDGASPQVKLQTMAIVLLGTAAPTALLLFVPSSNSGRIKR